MLTTSPSKPPVQEDGCSASRRNRLLLMGYHVLMAGCYIVSFAAKLRRKSVIPKVALLVAAGGTAVVLVALVIAWLRRKWNDQQPAPDG